MLYASGCDSIFSHVFVTYGYGLDVNVKTHTYFLRPGNVSQNTLYASRCDNVLSNVLVTYEYGLDLNIKNQDVIVTFLQRISEYVICKSL